MAETTPPSEPISAREIFEGKDTVVGEKLVEMVIAEEIGVPVYQVNFRNKKINLLSDRKPGENDITFRQKEEFEEKLIGTILPVANTQNEYIFLGIREGGIVFAINDDFHKKYWGPKFDRLTSARFDCDDSFQKTILNVSSGTKVTFVEHQSPQAFIKIAIESVEAKRQVLKAIKEKRSETRKELLAKLYGNNV